MGLFHHRPLFLWCTAFVVAAASGYLLFDVWSSPVASPWAVFLCLLAVLAAVGGMLCLLWRQRADRMRRIVTAAIACVMAAVGLSMSFVTFAGPYAMHLKAYVGETAVVDAVVRERRGTGGYLSSFALELTSVDGRDADGAALLTCHYLADLTPGEKIRVTAQVISLEEAAGDGYSAGALRGDGYGLALLSESEGDVVSAGMAEDMPLSIRLAELRRMSAARLNLLTEDAAGIPSALLLGEKAALRDEVRRDFSRVGVSHLLAISGLHVTLIFGLLDGILRLFLRKRRRAVVLGGMAFLYLLLLGFPPSATRAVVMLGFVYLSVLLSARADALTSLGVSGVLILLCFPYAAADAGFWMSYLATLGLVAVMPWVNTCAYELRKTSKTNPFLGRVKAGAVKIGVGVAVGVLAVSCTLSVVAAVMGEMGILSPIATLFLTPLCGVVLLLSMAALPFFGTSVGLWIGGWIEEICSWMTDMSAWMARPRWVVLSLGEPWVLPVTIVMTAALFLLLCVKLSPRRRWFVVLPLLIGWVVVGGGVLLSDALERGTPKVSFLQPSAQSDMLVLVEGRDAVICDLSNGSFSALSAASAEASRRGATEIAVLMLTHYHRRTAGALGDLFAREMVRQLWIPTPRTREEFYFLTSYFEKAEEAGVAVVLYDPAERLRVFETSEICLYTTELNRSEQPVLLVTVDTDPLPDRGGELVYCGSAVFESQLAEEAGEAVASADAVIFGNHGPLTKQRFGENLSFRADVEAVISDKGDMVTYVCTDAFPLTGRIWLGQWRYTFTKKSQ